MKKIILYMTLCLIGMVQVACDQDIDRIGQPVLHSFLTRILCTPQ